MAIANADGSIVLSTKVDVSGIKKGFSEITNRAKQSVTAIKQIGGVMKTILGYFVGIQTVFSAINYSKEAANFAIEQEASVQRLIDIYGVASEEVGNFIDLNARALGISKASAVGFSAVYGNLFSVWADQATNAELTNQYLNMTAVIASKTGRTVEDVQERIRSGLLGNTEAVEDLGVFVNVKTIEMTEAFQRIADGRSWEQLTAYEQSQVRTLAILEQSTKKYGNQVTETNTLVRAQYFASYQDLQATWGQLVNTVFIPVLKVATQVMDVLTTGMRVIAGLTGKTLEGFSTEQEKTKKINQNIEEQAKNQKGLNKELKKSLASFDELNTISQDTGSGAGAGGGSNVPGIDTEGFDFGTAGSANAVEEVNAMIAGIMGAVGVGLVAIGLLLCASGSIAWGIGFIVAGAGLLGVTMATLKSNAVSQEVKDALSIALILSGMVAIILGILCCTAQHWVVGIALIATGAASLGFAVKQNKSGIKQQMQGAFGGALAVIGLVAIILGVLCCTAQMWGIGIGLIVVGALSVGSVVAVNWDIIKTTLQGKLGKALVIVGIVAIVLGILCCVTGHWGLGLGYILAGGLAVGTVVTVNWDTILEKLKSLWAKIKAWWDTNVAKYFTATWWGDLAKNAINGFIRWIVNGLNKLIDKINSFGFDLPEKLGGGRIGFNISKLNVPQLAKGAVLPPNKPFLAMVGDQKSGTNIEAPLDTIVEAVKIALGGSNGFSGRIEVPVYLGNRQIALAVREAENEMGTETVVGGFANAY